VVLIIKKLKKYQNKKRVALVKELNQTPQGTSWRQPCNTCKNLLFNTWL